MQPSRTSWAAVLCLLLSFTGCKGNESVEHGNVSFDLSRDGKTLVFSSAGGDLFLLELASNKVTRLTETKGVESNPVLAPDGKSVAFGAPSPVGGRSSIYVMNLGDKVVRRVTTEDNFSDTRPAFSPDGKRIAFVRAQRFNGPERGGVWLDKDIYIVNLEGGKAQALTENNFFILKRPRFQPDDSKVMFTANLPYSSSQIKEENGGMLDSLVLVDIKPPHDFSSFLTRPDDGLELNALASDGDFAPDGKKAVFISDRGKAFHYDVYVIALDGSEAKALNAISYSKYNKEPTFTPDGKSIYFLAGVESNAGSRPIFSLYKTDLEGKNPQEVADSGLFTDPMKWKPKSK